MRPLSRHLPSSGATDTRMPVIGKIVLTIFLSAIVYWIYVAPYKALVILGTIIGITAVIYLLDRRMIAKLRRERDDTICDFRKAFNLREVDPWLIRATYEAFGYYIDQKQAAIPLRASDSIGHVLRIDPEDMWDLVCEVAQRAGYDISDCETNPLFGRIQSVEDFVIFINHQPRIQEAEQVMALNRP